MSSIKLFILVSVVSILLIGCDKSELIVKAYIPNVAPCPIVEEVVEIDSIVYGPSANFPQATMTITFVNTDLEVAFNKIPATGMYYMVPNMIGSYTFDNQMATVQDSGSFRVFSCVTDYPEVYIENYNNELIISYCDLSNSGFFNYDQTIHAYIGNPTGSRKIRMSY